MAWFGNIFVCLTPQALVLRKRYHISMQPWFLILKSVRFCWIWISYNHRHFWKSQIDISYQLNGLNNQKMCWSSLQRRWGHSSITFADRWFWECTEMCYDFEKWRCNGWHRGRKLFRSSREISCKCRCRCSNLNCSKGY